jgi:DNA-binding PadR family transcriptional regulator
MTTLTRTEELIMLSILQLGENAYLVALQDYLAKVINKKISLTSVHLPLSRLEKNGLVEGEMGEATAIRGGRRKKIYHITKLGFEILEAHKKISDTLWQNYSKLAIH